MRRLPVIAASALAFTACFYPAERGRALEARVDKMNTELSAKLQTQQERLDGTIPKIDSKIAEVQKALDGLDKASRRSDADIGIQMQKATEDVAQLRGQVETYVHKIDELQNQLNQLKTDTDAKITELQGEEAKAAAEAKKRADEMKLPGEPKPFLALANEKAKAKELPLAEKLYADFLRKWPKDPAVVDAHYGLAEAYAADDRCPDAIYEYGQVAVKYPKHKLAPEALLHSSDCFVKTKDTENAKRALEQILSDYPKSEAAKAAKTKLVDLNKKKPAAPAKKPGKAPTKPAGKK